MVKTIAQAHRIQAFRFADGKRGFARAVRRFINKNTKDWYGAQAMKSEMLSLPITPVEKELPHVEV